MLVLLGLGLVILGLVQTLLEIHPQLPSISGGAVTLIFIGPIPIFLGWGAPIELVLILIILMVIITILGLILRRSARGL